MNYAEVWMITLIIFLFHLAQQVFDGCKWMIA